MDDNQVLEQIIRLIEKKMGKYKKPLTRDTKLESDLGITGDDAFELIEEYANQFNVDLTNFDIKKHFAPEGDGILSLLADLITAQKTHYNDLTIGELEKAVLERRLG